jgi:transcriptional regulator with XRE-family HTH domain
MLGTRIASLRQSHGFSQAQLARKLHISTSAVGMYEQGRREPSVETLVELSQLFGVSLDYLLSGRPDTLRDVVALHRLAQEGCNAPQELSKEEMVCHLLWALLE